MGILLGVLVCAFAIPALVPAVSHGPLSTRLRAAVIVFAFAASLQLLFIVLVSIGLLRLENSLKVAGVGAPCCLVALVLATKDRTEPSVSRGVLYSSILGLAMWLVLITLH